MDLDTFTGGKLKSCITPALIAHEIKRILSAEGYMGCVSHSHDFVCVERGGVEFYELIIRFGIGECGLSMRLRPRHLMLSIDEFNKEILWPHIGHMVY